MARNAHAQRPRIVPVTYRVACSFAGRRLAVRRHLFSLAAIAPTGQMIAVAQVAHPGCRELDDGTTAELAHLTPSAPEVHTQLTRIAWRITYALGYRRLIHRPMATANTTGVRDAGMRLRVQPSGRAGSRLTWELRDNTTRHRGRA